MCRSHGAQLPAVQHAAARAVEDARLRLLLATEDAVVVLETLMDEGQSEAVRLRAAVEILDRAGIRGGVEIRPLPVHESPAEVLQQRLATLSRRMSEARDRQLPITNDRGTAPDLVRSRCYAYRN